MRYWWVNQNQTYSAESQGGYLWSPKRNKNGVLNRFYENMREVSPGDLIFSFRDTRIAAVSIATSYCYESPRPEEFGRVGEQWDRSGWKVDATYREMAHPIRPKSHMAILAPLLPEKYAPLQSNGEGNQVYLAEVGAEFANALLALLREAGNALPNPSAAPPTTETKSDEVIEAVEDRQERLLAQADLESTEKQAIIQARRGQGLFRQRLQQIERGCRMTGVEDQAFLIASHIKPWRASDNRERLDGENGLFLTPTLDRLFDRGFISFGDDGELLVSPVLQPDVARRLGLPGERPFRVGAFSAGQQGYLAYHREFILKKTL